jgi:hypothetical protein
MPGEFDNRCCKVMSCWDWDWVDARRKAVAAAAADRFD